MFARRADTPLVAMTTIEMERNDSMFLCVVIAHRKQSDGAGI
jgi:hypothetical protein